MFKKNLISAINSGKCVALIGSGPSCEVGLPSWHNLVEKLVDRLSDEIKQEKIELINIHKLTKEYDKALQIIEESVGKSKLYSETRLVFMPPSPCEGFIYKILTRWPFAFYMTTNYDSFIQSHLNTMGLHFQELNNSDQDLTTINVESKDIILKLHGDLVDERTVLTSRDYELVANSPEWEIFREKLTNIFLCFQY